MINFSSSLSGLRSSVNSLNVTANNLANTNTPGFKEQRAITATSPVSGSITQAVQTNISQGAVQYTGNAFDLAVNGKGFFQLSLPNGETGFTRSGSFRLNNQGQITDPQGNALFPGVRVPADATSVAVDGTGKITAMAGGQQQTIGQIQLATFSNPDGLARKGGNILTATSASGQPRVNNPGNGGTGSVIGGAQEASNVDISGNMVSLIIDKNSFKANLNAIKAGDEMSKTAISLKA